MREVSDAALTPLAFLERSGDVWADRIAVRDGNDSSTYGQHLQRIRQAIGGLRSGLGVKPGDRVATVLPNVTAMLELHYAIPGVGAVLVPLNTRLSLQEYEYILAHSEARVVVADPALRETLEAVAKRLGSQAPQLLWNDSEGYQDLVENSGAEAIHRPEDERALLSINYTSGTTGRPKGVMTSHRGAYLHSLGVLAEAALVPGSRYLWTLPMFHCNGWAFIWAVTAMGARQVCMPKFDAGVAWDVIHAEGVTHLCAAPTVLVMLLRASGATRAPWPVRIFVGGAPPAPSMLERAERLNLDVTHLYGLTETYGPIGVCAWSPEWNDLPSADQAQLKARQGVSTIVSEPLRVVDANMRDVPRNGQAIGEIVMRGNNVLLGYYHDPEATREAFAGGWFHSGDLAVQHPDGYIEIRDRLKDIVISGGENVSTVEVEQTLVAHPAVAEAAVVGVPDERWGEAVVAFVTAATGEPVDVGDLRRFVLDRLTGFKVPKSIEVVADLPKTSTGKIQKFVLREQARGGGRQ